MMPQIRPITDLRNTAEISKLCHTEEAFWMKTPEELNALKEEVEALNSKLAELSEDELAKVSGGRIVRDPEEISGAGSGSSGHLVLDDSDPHEAEELHFPSSDNGLEDTGDVNRRLGI